MQYEKAGKEINAELDGKVRKLVEEFEEFMNDDISTAKVLANMFELAPIINSIKDGHIAQDAISANTLQSLKDGFKIFLEDIFGLKQLSTADNVLLDGVMHLLIDIRKEAKAKKDYSTSDKIRKQLVTLGIEIKDEKDGNISWNIG